MRLFGTQSWDSTHVERVIKFEREVARALPSLLASMASASDYADAELYAEFAPSDGPYALARAAEVAFATDQFLLGVEICVELLKAPYARPKTSMQYVQWAAIGTALGLVRVRLDASGASISLNADTKVSWFTHAVQIPWPPAASQARRLAQRLIPAAIVSGNAYETIEPMLFQTEGRGQAAAAMIELTDEFAAALSLDRRFTGREEVAQGLGILENEIELKRLQNRTFDTLESAYSNRLTAMRRTPMWRMLRVRGSLIDWSLLLLWIARLRRNGSAQPAGPWLEDVTFIRDLAERFVQYTIAT
jgi:hypothetical protein